MKYRPCFFEHQESKCLSHRLLVAGKLALKLLDVLFQFCILSLLVKLLVTHDAFQFLFVEGKVFRV